MSDTRRMRANTGNRIALGILILLVALFIFICTCGAFGGVGDMVSSVFVGFFGLADYAYSLVAAAAGVAVELHPQLELGLEGGEVRVGLDEL